jgi:hypothetical protein
VKLAVDAAAEDLHIEENFVCEFGALFRHRFFVSSHWSLD